MGTHRLSLLTAFIFVFGCMTNSFGQHHKSCGHDHAQIKQFGSKENFEKIKSEILRKRAKQPLSTSNQKSNISLTIPVVVHVIHDGEPVGTGSNIADGQVLAQLASLNDDFAGTNSNFSDDTRASWDAVKGSPMISFCLATTDPSGSATSGIVRHQIAITGTDANNNNIEAIKDSIFWDSNDYLNVYVLSIPGTSAAGGVVGYAYLPYFGTVGYGNDGIVVDYNWFGGVGYSQSGNKTLTHEMGHYLGLFHTFSGDSCGSDDGLDDTPNVSQATSDLSPTLNCGDPMNRYPTAPTSCGNETMFINYMDYVNDDNCPIAFSDDQVELMRSVLLGTAAGFVSRAPLVANTNTACAGGTICELFANTSTSTACPGTATGSATVIASSGTGTYSYTWSTDPVQTTATATGLTSGTYYVTVTDAAGCSVATIAVVTESTPMSTAVESTDLTSPGANDGTATVTAIGGQQPYTYLWTGGQTTATASNLSPGEYTVTVTDGNSCMAIDLATINDFECSPLDFDLSSDGILCAGGPGDISVTSISGNGPFTYLWNTSDTASVITVSTAGTYSATVTDTDGCTHNESITISEPSAITVDVSKSDVSQVGGSDGSITITASGGTPSLTYLWNDGPTSASRSGLMAGIYSLIVTDANLCAETVSVTISDATCEDVVFSPMISHVTCFGGTDGSIDLNIQQINAPYTSEWSTGATGDVISNLSAGTYAVTLTDAAACEEIRSYTINEPSLITASIQTTDESSYQSEDGSLVVSASGGTGALTYLWDTGATSTSVANLAPGVYSVTISDANGCQVEESAEVQAYTCPAFDITSVNTTDNECFGETQGVAGVSISGGTAPYAFAWNTGETTAVISDLASGVYEVTVTDDRNCPVSAVAVISEPSALVVNPSIQHVSAVGLTDGQITLDISGGIAPYTINWNTGDTTSVIDNLQEGLYTYTVTDANGCTSSADVTIEQYVCPQLSITIDLTSVSCRNSADGSLTASTSGGTAPYSYIWSTSTSGSTINDLAPGVYDVTATDSKGCTVQSSVELINPDLLTFTTQVTHETGNQSEDGTASVVITGGSSPYTTVWDNGVVGTDNADLAPGLYNFEIADMNGCIVTGQVTIDAFVCPQIQATVDIIDNQCGDGGVDVTVMNGTAPYHYIIDDVSYDTASIRGLTVGTYDLEIVDINGCSTVVSFQIDTPLEMAITNIAVEDAEGILPGSATVEIEGGVEPYDILWSDGRTNPSNNALFPGIHTVIVTDAQGCSVQQDVIIHQTDESQVISDLLLFETHPNPVQNSVRLQMEFENDQFVRIVITDLGGAPVFEDEVTTSVYNNTVDVSDLAKGFYNVVIYTSEEVISKPLIKL